jgi:hypothetical protein
MNCMFLCREWVGAIVRLFLEYAMQSIPTAFNFQLRAVELLHKNVRSKCRCFNSANSNRGPLKPCQTAPPSTHFTTVIV